MEQTNVAPDAFLAICPSRRLLATISGKWSVLILVALADGPIPFAEIERKVEGISSKVLSQTLRKLEGHRLVARQTGGKPRSRVSYALDGNSIELISILTALKRWAEGHLNLQGP